MTVLQTGPRQMAGMGSGIVKLEEKIVSYSPIDRQNMVKDFTWAIILQYCTTLFSRSLFAGP